MRKIFIFIFIFNYTAIFYSQNILWEKSFGGIHDDIFKTCVRTEGNGFLVGGASVSDKNGNKNQTKKGGFDFSIWRLNEVGDILWQKNYGGDKDDILEKILKTSDGGYLLAGTSKSSLSGDKNSNNIGKEDFWVIKINENGDILWQKSIGGSQQDLLSDIDIQNDGGILVSGSSESNRVYSDFKSKDVIFKNTYNNGNLDFWIIKLDKYGNEIWQKSFGGIYKDELIEVINNTNNEIFLCGTSNSPVSKEKMNSNYGLNDYWIIKLNISGDVLWQNVFGGSGEDYLTSAILYENEILLGGTSNSKKGSGIKKDNISGFDFWILKINEDGNEVFQKSYDFSKNDVLTDLTAINTSEIILSGYTLNDKLNKNYSMLKINLDGDEIWRKTFNTKSDDFLRKSYIEQDNSIIFLGTSKGNNKLKNSLIGRNDMWILKLKNIEDNVIENPLIAYPNPVINKTKVKVDYNYVSGFSNLYDINGRSLETKILNGEKEINFDLTGFSSGIYIIEIKTNFYNHSIKIIKN